MSRLDFFMVFVCSAKQQTWNINAQNFMIPLMRSEFGGTILRLESSGPSAFLFYRPKTRVFPQLPKLKINFQNEDSGLRCQWIYWFRPVKGSPTRRPANCRVDPSCSRNWIE